jgi:hypothetical protein
MFYLFERELGTDAALRGRLGTTQDLQELLCFIGDLEGLQRAADS